MEGIKRKILIVDDDNFILDMYAFKFNQNNFEVYTASSGMHALEKIKNNLRPDVVLMDIAMPDLDGFEVLEQINTQRLCPSCIKIILSNKSEQKDIDKSRQLGVEGYIVKANSTPSEVIDQVIKILKEKIVVSK